MYKLREHFHMFSKSLLRCFAGDVALRAFAPLKDLLPPIVVFYLKQGKGRSTFTISQVHVMGES